jgi:hypothetical protein
MGTAAAFAHLRAGRDRKPAAWCCHAALSQSSLIHQQAVLGPAKLQPYRPSSQAGWPCAAAYGLQQFHPPSTQPASWTSALHASVQPSGLTPALSAFAAEAASEDSNLYTYDMRRLDVARCVHQDFVSAVMDVDYSPTGAQRPLLHICSEGMRLCVDMNRFEMRGVLCCNLKNGTRERAIDRAW